MSICRNAKFYSNDEFSIKNITTVQDKIFYKGKPASYTIKKVLGKGTFGDVMLVDITTHEGVFQCAYKKIRVGKEHRGELSELKVLEDYPMALTCEGIIDMVRTPEGGVFMPLANGDLSNLAKYVNLTQACQIALQIGRQLKCLLGHSIYYFDVKPANCVFFCRQPGRVDVSLADMGSIIPDEGFYMTSHPPPMFHDGAVMPSEMSYRHIESYYTLLLLNLICAICTNDYIIVYSQYLEEYEAEAEDGISKFVGFLSSQPPSPLVEYLSKIAMELDFGNLEETLPPVGEFLIQLGGS